MKEVYIYLLIAVASIGATSALWLGASHKIVVDLSEVNRRDSIIAIRESQIDSLNKVITSRDTIISALVSKETEQRGTVFFHLEDKFEEATDSVKESLIEEALISIQ